jgi:hypothetical protein
MKQTHYEVLGVDPRATPEQIEKAYRFALEMYGDAALATYSLLAPEELAEMRGEVEEAYGVLRDPLKRQLYDGGDRPGASSLPLPFPKPEPVAEMPAPPPSPAVVTTPGPAPRTTLTEPVTGERLRRARQDAGVTLQDIAASTKIGVRFLEYIELDRFALLPAPVYLRSFLTEYAKAVGLDPRQTAEAYMARLPRTT